MPVIYPARMSRGDCKLTAARSARSSGWKQRIFDELVGLQVELRDASFLPSSRQGACVFLKWGLSWLVAFGFLQSPDFPKFGRVLSRSWFLFWTDSSTGGERLPCAPGAFGSLAGGIRSAAYGQLRRPAARPQCGLARVVLGGSPVPTDDSREPFCRCTGPPQKRKKKTNKKKRKKTNTKQKGCNIDFPSGA